MTEATIKLAPMKSEGEKVIEAAEMLYISINKRKRRFGCNCVRPGSLRSPWGTTFSRLPDKEQKFYIDAVLKHGLPDNS